MVQGSCVVRSSKGCGCKSKRFAVKASVSSFRLLSNAEGNLAAEQAAEGVFWPSCAPRQAAGTDTRDLHVETKAVTLSRQKPRLNSALKWRGANVRAAPYSAAAAAKSPLFLRA